MGLKIDTGNSQGPDSDINVAPLIDVVLVMLIIFMVAVPIKIDEIAANLPKKTEVVEQKDMPEDQLVIMGWTDGSYGLNKVTMELDDVYEELRVRLKFKKSRVVFVDAHPDVPVHRIVKMMDVARMSGAERVAMARLKPEGPRQYTAEEIQMMETYSAEELLEIRAEKRAAKAAGELEEPAPE